VPLHPRIMAMAALALVLALATAGCGHAPSTTAASALPTASASALHQSTSTALAPQIRERETPKARRLAEAAMAQVGKTVSYDAAYVALAYPGGDVPVTTGVCSDVVVRAFRGIGTDLQVKVHEDMAKHFSAYPHKWGLTKPDASIDHRRVPNLQTYFERRGASRRVTGNGADYWPGDMVTWMVYGRPHIGIVSTTPAADGTHFLVTHNIGRGAQTEDVLFAFPITKHYRRF
jgi:uncharacterized protein